MRRHHLGAGKTTVAGPLGDRLQAIGSPVHVTTQPSRARLGRLARHNTDRYRGLTLACLVAADQYHHLETDIRPHLEQGEIVICDRYVASSYVLQQMDGVPMDFIESINSHAEPPDLAVLLMSDPAVAASRIAGRGSHGRFETGIETSTAEADLYGESYDRLVASGVPVLVVDTTSHDPDQVATQIAERIIRGQDGPSEQGATA